jgi:hypothetical protein
MIYFAMLATLQNMRYSVNIIIVPEIERYVSIFRYKAIALCGAVKLNWYVSLTLMHRAITTGFT